jgi:diguanylate cyclase (GGDEF)-like protein
MPPNGMSALVPPASRGSQEDADAFYQNAPCGYLTMRRDGTILGANRTLLGWVRQGVEAAEAGLRFCDMLTPASWVFFSMKCVPVMAMHGRIAGIALDILRPDRSTIPVLASFEAAGGAAGEPQPLIHGILLDATERRLYERELLAARKAAEEVQRASEQAGARLAAVLESTTDGVLLVDLDWRVSYANPRAGGLQPGPLTGEDVRRVFPCERDSVFLDAFCLAMGGELGEGVEGPVGESAWLWVRAYPAPGGGMAVFFRDSTQERLAADERRRNAERIEHLASHDTLTDLPNRRLFAARLREALAAADEPVALMCLDLDRFKQVNDRLGHPAGDALLRVVADRLRAELRGEDTAARFGGDEFAVLLGAAAQQGGIRPEARAEEVAGRIVRKLSAPYAIGVDHVEISVSVGITLSAGRDADPDALLAEADFALYEAKRAGRGCHAVFRPAIMSQYRTRLELGNALRQGLERGELLLHYQPVVEVAGRHLCGHEALVRWDRPGLELLPPTTFIPLAEEAGLIVQLGAFVLGRACRDAAAWPNPTLRVTVNMSPLQFRDPGLVDTVAEALGQSGLAPARLELEITESLLLDRMQDVLATMHRLREMGIGFAMDDFGTGFSSLSSLRSFPFDRVKIDRSFLREAETRNEDMAIIESVAALCWRLGIGCLAEGVETEGQLALLARVGCDEAQGYLLGRPVPQAELLRLASRPLERVAGRVLTQSEAASVIRG